MGLVAGARSTENAGAINPVKLVVDMDDLITNVERKGNENKTAALTVLTSNIKKKRVVTNYKYQCMEDNFNTREGTITASITNSQTSITLNSSFEDYLTAGSIVIVPSTLERMLVTAVATATNSLTVIRNLGGAVTGAVAAAEGDGVLLTAASVTLMHIDDSYAEGTSAPAAKTTQVDESYNLTMIEKTTVDFTGTELAMKMYGPNDEAYQIGKKLNEHLRKINSAMWFSARASRADSTAGTSIRATAGVFQHIKGNLLDIATTYGGILTMKVWDAFMEQAMENGSDLKYYFCGHKMNHAFDSIARNVVRVDSMADSFGTDMKEIVTSAGTVRIVREPKIFTGDLAGYGVLLDLEQLKYVCLQGRDTKLHKNVKDVNHDGYDGRKHLIQTEFGLDMRGYGLDADLAATTGSQRSVHGMLYGFSDY